MEHIVGAHTIDTGGIHMAARRAASADMRALQIFSAIPKFYGDKTSVRPERLERFKATIAATKIRPEHIVVHAAYVLNVATPEEEKWTRARDGLTKELERSTSLGAGAVCFHPGAANDGDRAAAAERIAVAIVHALETVPAHTRLLVENTAGAGNTMARTAEEVGLILRDVPTGLRARTGYGLDTCHLYASGYDLARRPRRGHARARRIREVRPARRPDSFTSTTAKGRWARTATVTCSSATGRSAKSLSAGCCTTGARSACRSSSRRRSSTPRSARRTTRPIHTTFR